MRPLSSICSVLVAVAISSSTDLLTAQDRPGPQGRDVIIQGQKLVGAYIVSVTDTRVTVQHSRGPTFFHPKVVPQVMFDDFKISQENRAEYDSQLRVKAEFIQVLDEGAIAKVWFVKQVTREQRVEVPGTLLDTGPRYKTQTVEGEELIPWEDRVFIYGIPSNYVDGQTWSGRVFPAGTYSYTAVTGAAKKLRAVATSQELANKIISQKQ